MPGQQSAYYRIELMAVLGRLLVPVLLLEVHGSILPNGVVEVACVSVSAVRSPHLVKLAVGLKHACLMATSVPCERVFSQSGQLLNERRSRLKAKNVHMVLFLHQNSKLL